MSLNRSPPNAKDFQVSSTTSYFSRAQKRLIAKSNEMSLPHAPRSKRSPSYYRTVAEERGISITNKGDGEVYADARLFDRALSNLLDNALRFTPDGGKITIATETKPDRTELAIEDTGCGIPPQHLPRIFDRFYRADSSRSSQGTGLGLALVKSITDLHGGSVEVASEVNRGTTVTLTFPAKPMDDPAGAPTRE